MMNRGIFTVQCGRSPAGKGLLLLLLCLLSCAGQAEISVIDDAGQTLVLEQPARRIVSLAVLASRAEDRAALVERGGHVIKVVNLAQIGILAGEANIDSATLNTLRLRCR